MDDSDTVGAGLACNLGAIAPGQRDAHAALAAELFQHAAQETIELPDGYAFRFGEERYADLARFIENERRCCPFFSFTLEVAPRQAPIWLRICGPAGAKELLHTTLPGSYE